jgi:uncharacterized protein HemX
MRTPTNNVKAPPTKLQRFLNGFNSALPVAALVWAICLTIGGYWLYVRDSQTVQAQEVKELKQGQKTIEKTMEDRKQERDKQFQELKEMMLTKEVFNVYHKADTERMERMEKMLERLLEK